jgi:uncharacterized protein (DUF4415 family)
MGRHLSDDTSDLENPEWTAEDFARAKPTTEIPALTRLLKPGRPAMAEDDRKQRVTMYLDRDVIETLKQDGKGWQTRANAKLRAALGL